MYSYIWIEGEKNLDEFCMKRFGDKPRFLEHFASISGNGATAKIEKREVEDAEGYYHPMYLLTMRHDEGRFSTIDIEREKKKTYEDIGTDRKAILRKRG